MIVSVYGGVGMVLVTLPPGTKVNVSVGFMISLGVIVSDNLVIKK